MKISCKNVSNSILLICTCAVTVIYALLLIRSSFPSTLFVKSIYIKNTNELHIVFSNLIKKERNLKNITYYIKHNLDNCDYALNKMKNDNREMCKSQIDHLAKYKKIIANALMCTTDKELTRKPKFNYILFTIIKGRHENPSDRLTSCVTAWSSVRKISANNLLIKDKTSVFDDDRYSLIATIIDIESLPNVIIYGDSISVDILYK